LPDGDAHLFDLILAFRSENLQTNGHSMLTPWH
jgi:hypothetical protein